MQKLILLLFIQVFTAICALGQDPMFRSIDMGYTSDVGVQILPMEDGYLIAVVSVCNDPQIVCWGLLRVDTNGEVIYKKHYNAHPEGGRWAPMFFNGLTRLGNRYYIAGDIMRPELDFQVFFMEFDPATGDSLSYLEQGNIHMDLNRFTTTISDGNIVLLNVVQFAEKKAWLQKWTPDMELLWEQFVGPSFQWENPTSLVELPNGDFLFTRNSCNIPTGCLGTEFLSLTRTDSTGNELWTYTHPVRTRHNPISMVHLGGDTVAVSWGRNLWAELDSINPFPAAVLWFDGEAEQFRQFDFPADFIRTIHNMRRTANGDIVGMGYADLRTEGLGLTGWVFRLSPQGALLWERYILDPSAPVLIAYFHDMVEDTDGSLVLTGLHRASLPDSVPGISNPNVWLVRLDSTGCLEPGCGAVQIVTSAQEIFAPASEKPMLIAAPNPADGFFALHLPGFAQPVFPLHVRLWDMQGRQVQAFTAQEYPVFVRTDHLPPGMYVAQVRTAAGQAGVVKVVKSR